MYHFTRFNSIIDQTISWINPSHKHRFKKRVNNYHLTTNYNNFTIFILLWITFVSQTSYCSRKENKLNIHSDIEERNKTFYHQFSSSNLQYFFFGSKLFKQFHHRSIKQYRIKKKVNKWGFNNDFPLFSSSNILYLFHRCSKLLFKQFPK